MKNSAKQIFLVSALSVMMIAPVTEISLANESPRQSILHRLIFGPIERQGAGSAENGSENIDSVKRNILIDEMKASSISENNVILFSSRTLDRIEIDENSGNNISIRLWISDIVAEHDAKNIAQSTVKDIISELIENDINPRTEGMTIIARVWTDSIPPSPTGQKKIAAMGTATYFWIDDQIDWRQGP